MKLADLKHRHAGATVWIIGTGPGLDQLDPGEITGPRVLLNRAAFLPEFTRTAKPGESYWLVMDDAGFLDPNQPWWLEHLGRVVMGRANQTAVFRDPLLNSKPMTDAPHGDNIITWGAMPSVGSRRDALKFDRDRVCSDDFLYVECGSAAPATHLAWLMGAAAVRYVGLDGGRGRAACLQRFYGEPEMPGFGYSMSTSCAYEVADALGLTVHGHRPEFCK